MSLESLPRRDVRTSLGVVPLWSPPETFDAKRPLLLAIAGLFASPDDLSRLPEMMAPVADAAILRIPGAGPPALKDPSLQGFARAIDEVIGQLFADRPVVMFGLSIGATAALGVRAPAVRRIVAVEPILATEELWPLDTTLRAHLRAMPKRDPAHDLYWQLFGLSADRRAPRDHRDLLKGLEVPVDVLLAGQPLFPERKLEAFPSLVTPAERERLAALPQVRLHQAPGAPHNVTASAGRQLRELLFEACRRAAADPAGDPRRLDEPLLEATPLTARRIAHWGPGGTAFRDAYLAWNPIAEVALLGEADDPSPSLPVGAAGFDAVVLGASPPPLLLPRLAGALRPGGDLVARWSSALAAPAAVGEALANHGLALAPAVDAAGTGVLRARKAAAFPVPLKIEMVAFAPRLMDVRTRLPARGLRTDPELMVDYILPPYVPGAAPLDAPKVMVLQRQAPTSLEAGRGQLAFAIARGWIVVIEYDDHPDLVAETLGRPPAPTDLDRFAYAHAVQTSTEPLAELFGRRNPEVRVFGNTVFELAPAPRQEADPPRRVIYGAVSRGEFGVAIARSLAPVVAEFPDVEFLVLGDREVFEALPAAKKVYEDYLPYEAYLARMAGCAVSLSPIESLPMRETKSDAKFLDAARAGVVTIGSPVIYGGVIRHGENGLLAERLEDWAPMLRQALADPAATRAMGRRAWEHVREQRMFAAQVAQRRDWYRDLWARREALNRAAFDRVPGLAEAVAAERAKLGL